MIHYHRDIFKYEVPNDWYVGYEQEYLQIYNEEVGLGALTASFYVNLEWPRHSSKVAENMAQSFINQYQVKLLHPMKWNKISNSTNVFAGEGVQGEYYVRMWVIVDHLRIILATYFSEQHFDDDIKLSPELENEVAQFESIINSITFLN